VHSKVRDKQMK